MSLRDENYDFYIAPITKAPGFSGAVKLRAAVGTSSDFGDEGYRQRAGPSWGSARKLKR
jgi:hypothetical protein